MYTNYQRISNLNPTPNPITPTPNRLPIESRRGKGAPTKPSRSRKGARVVSIACRGLVEEAVFIHVSCSCDLHRRCMLLSVEGVIPQARNNKSRRVTRFARGAPICRSKPPPPASMFLVSTCRLARWMGASCGAGSPTLSAFSRTGPTGHLKEWGCRAVSRSAGKRAVNETCETPSQSTHAYKR